MFSGTQLLDNLYYAVNEEMFIFGFLEQGIYQNPDYHDYLGVVYKNIDLGPSPCLSYIKISDDFAFCEEQPDPLDFVIVAPKKQWSDPGLLAVWKDLTAKLRP